MSVVPAKLVIASRESRLAMWQSEHVCMALRQLYPACQVSILGMSTKGDQILDRSLSRVGGKGLFVKELETALESGNADLAVHSLKDVPMEMPPGLALAVILQREDPLDAFVSNQFASLEDLPAGSVVGTSSLRREASLRAAYPELVIRSLRGNVDTRLAKLDRGEYHAIILAAAGLKRLGLGARIRTTVSPDVSLPAAGQGAICIEVRADRVDLLPWLAPLHHGPSALAVYAERAVSRRLGGSCQVPLAAHAQWRQDALAGSLDLQAWVATPDGRESRTAQSSAAVDNQADAEALGERVANALLDQGAGALLAQACAAER